MNLLYLVVPPIVLYAIYVAFRRTRLWWIKRLFPLGYALYNSRIGYSLHLRKLNKKPSPHSIVGPTSLSVVKVVPLAVLDDNYSYLVIDTVTDVGVVVDPSDPAVVMKAVLDNNVALKGVLTTHKHWDHAGGNHLLKSRFPELKIYGSSYEQVPGATDQVKDGDIIRFERMSFTAIWTPGHTKGHVAYKLNNEPPCLFSGDHLFICGAGQMFEGSADEMEDSLAKVKCLPFNTLIFPGHEYTLRNLNFTVQLLPSNAAVQNKMKWVRQQRDRNLSTVPSIMSEEIKYNPFLFTESPILRDALSMSSDSTPAQVLTELRKQKNIFDKAVI